MKQYFLISSLLCLFIQQKNLLSEGAPEGTQFFKEIEYSKIQPFSNGEVTVTSKYLTDADGYNYGCVFYITNTSNTTMGVKWWFEGNVNVNFSPESSGRIVLPGNTSGVLLTTCTSADKSKGWKSGTVRYNWDPA